MKIGYINLNTNKVASSEVLKRDYPITLITEPYQYAGQVRLLKGPSVEVLYAKSKRPRTCIRIKKDIKHVFCPQYSSMDVCTVQIKLKDGYGYLAVAYLDGKIQQIDKTLVNLVRQCDDTRQPLLICMDGNSWSTRWSSRVTNARGIMVENFIDEYDIEVLNKGDIPTFLNANGSSIIDITLANRWGGIKFNVHDWKVDLKESFSDHRYVEFNIGLRQQCKMVRNLRKANWVLFQGILNSYEHGGITDANDIDSETVKLTNAITEALNAACPLKPLKFASNKWWNSELEFKRKFVLKLHKKKDRNPLFVNQYNEEKKAYKSLIYAAKKASWREYCSEFTGIGDISKTIKNLQNDVGPLGLLQDEEGDFCQDVGTSLKVLMDTHFPGSIDMIEQPEKRKVLNNGEITYIDCDLVRLSLKSFGKFKAEGPDGFKPVVLQHLPGNVLKGVVNIYRSSMEVGYVPELWRRMRVIFIPKPGKSSYDKAKSFRPITLSNFLLKGLERLIQWELQKRMPCLQYQHAYTENLSTETALSEVVDEIEHSVNRGQFTLMASLDCSGAFDNIDLDSAKRVMSNMGIDTNIIRWFDCLLRHRLISAELQGEVVQVVPTRGTPQGGVLSPFIWNLILNELLSQIRKPVRVTAYADDIALTVKGPDPNTLVDLLQHALNQVLSWASGNGLVFNPDKTQAVLFGRGQAAKNLKMNGKYVKYTDTLTYLGINLQKNLKWSVHINEKVKKAKALWHTARRLVGKHWGLDNEKIMWIHNIIVKPMVTYGALVWAHRIDKSSVDKLRSLQRQPLQSMARTLRSTPTRGMEAILGILPLDLYALKVGTLSRWRTRHLLADSWDGLHKNSGHLGHRKFHDNVLKELSCLGTIPDRQRTGDFTINFGLTTGKATLWAAGSVDEAVGGYGGSWTLEANNMSVSKSYTFNPCQHWQAEIKALNLGLEFAFKMKVSELHIVLTSRNCVYSLFTRRNRSCTLNECLKALEGLNCPVSVQHQKIGLPTPITATYNNARKGGISALVPTLAKRTRSLVSKHYHKIWETQWQSEETCKVTRQFFELPNRCLDLRFYSNKDINTLIQAGTGHGLFKSHLSKFRTWIGKDCDLCGADKQTSYHLWAECPALEEERRKTFYTLVDSAATYEQIIIEFFDSCRLKSLQSLYMSNRCDT